MARAILCYLENWKNGALLVSMHQKSNTVLSDRFCLEIKRSTDPENIYKRTINSEIFRAPIATSEKFDFFFPPQELHFSKSLGIFLLLLRQPAGPGICFCLLSFALWRDKKMDQVENQLFFFFTQSNFVYGCSANNQTLSNPTSGDRAQPSECPSGAVHLTPCSCDAQQDCMQCRGTSAQPCWCSPCDRPCKELGSFPLAASGSLLVAKDTF